MWKQPLIFYSLINPSPVKEWDSSWEFVDEESDVDDESDVELDRNNQLDLDLDLDLEHNDDDLESDLLSDSEDRAGSAEEF